MDAEEIGTDVGASPLLEPVHRLMTRPVVFADTEMTLRTLAATMAEESVGAVVLLGPDGPSTIVTERDIVEALADGADPDDTWAAEVASLDLVTADPDDTVAEVVRMMVTHDIRHVPVRAYGSVVGMVSARDVLRVVEAGS